MAEKERLRESEGRRENPAYYYHLCDRNEWGYKLNILYWWLSLSSLEFIRCCCKSLSISGTRWAMIGFHRIMFVLVLSAVLIKGGIDEGRRDMLNHLLEKTLLTMTLKQLTDLDVTSI